MASPVKYSTARGTIRSRMKWPISKSAARMASESSSWNQTVYSCISWTKWESNQSCPWFSISIQMASEVRFLLGGKNGYKTDYKSSGLSGTKVLPLRCAKMQLELVCDKIWILSKSKVEKTVCCQTVVALLLVLLNIKIHRPAPLATLTVVTYLGHQIMFLSHYMMFEVNGSVPLI